MYFKSQKLPSSIVNTRIFGGDVAETWVPKKAAKVSTPKRSINGSLWSIHVKIEVDFVMCNLNFYSGPIKSVL